MRVLDLDGREVENRAAQTDDAAERLSRAGLGRGKGRSSGNLAGLPFGFGFPPPGRDPLLRLPANRPTASPTRHPTEARDKRAKG
jgi:hypothetical protein